MIPSPRARVLLVDDRPAHRTVLRERLASGGHEVLSATSGDDALSRFAEEDVDCVLLCPVVGGALPLHACERLRRHPELCKLPLVVLTADATASGVVESLEAGADDCVPEADVDVVLARLGARLRGKKREEEGRRAREGSLLREVEGRSARALEDVEVRLRASEARARAIVDTAGDAIVTADEGGRITSFNPAAERLFGYRADELIGQDIGVLAASAAEGERHGHYVSQYLARRGRGAVGVNRRLSGRHEDGSEVPIEIVLSDVVLDDGGRTFVAIIHDMKRQQRTEDAMRLARERAEQASDAKSTFLAQMSHEIRTPMHAILGFAQLLEASDDLPSHLRDHVEIINASGEHLMTLLNDVLEMSRIESGRVQLNESVFDLAALVSALEGMFRVRVRAAGLALVRDLDRPLPRAVHGDAGKLRQILVNLLSNAAKFTSAGRIVLRLAFTDQDAARILLRVEVADTGIGIDPADLEGIFLPFHQTSLGQARGGTGLGLGISRSFARLMGGELGAESELGVGSTFTLEVPLALAARDDDPSPRRVVGLVPGQPTCRVLVLDDTETNLDFACALLRPLGFEVHVARDGQEGLAAAEALRPHVVLVDVRMPVLDGVSVIRAIRAWGDDRPRLVAVTAAAFEEDRERLASAGADDFVAKPFRASRLLEAIGRAASVAYVYGSSPAETEEAKLTLTPALVAAALSPEEARELRRTVELGDLDEARAILDDAHASAPEVVNALRRALESFDYALVLSVLRSHRPESTPSP